MFRVRLLSKLESARKYLTGRLVPGVLLFGLLGGLVGMSPTLARTDDHGPQGWRSEFLSGAGPIAYDEARHQLLLLAQLPPYGSGISQTWVFERGEWSQRSLQASPPPGAI